MATISPLQAAEDLLRAGATPTEASQLLSVIPGESGWNTQATNPSSGACGLWQIYPPEPGCYDPVQAAGIALRKLRSQGLGAWSAGPKPGDWGSIVQQAQSALGGLLGGAAGAVGGAVGVDIGSAITGAVASTGHGLADALGASVHDVGTFARGQAPALAVALVVALVLWGGAEK